MADGGGAPGQAELRLVKRGPLDLKDGLSSQSGNSWRGWWVLRRFYLTLGHSRPRQSVSPSLEGAKVGTRNP